MAGSETAIFAPPSCCSPYKNLGRSRRPCRPGGARERGGAAPALGHPAAIVTMANKSNPAAPAGLGEHESLVELHLHTATLPQL
jgi:hypothetical protein